MNPEMITTKIENLKEANKRDLENIENKVATLDSLSALSLEERTAKSEEIKNLETSIDELMQNIENRNKEIERQDKLLSLQTNSSMTKRNVIDDINTATNNNENESREDLTHYFKTGEIRDSLQASVLEKGGNLLAPQYLSRDIIKNLDSMVHIRAFSKMIPSQKGYQSIGIPTLEKDLDNLAWTEEVAEVPEDQNLTFGKREMKANQLTKLVLVSKKLIRESAIDIVGFVSERIAYKLAGTLEHNYLYGNGTSKPLGIFAQTSDNTAAIPTDRDVKVGTATIDITYEGLVDAVSALKSGYQKGAVWMFNRKAMAALRKLTDKQGRPIWQESLSSDKPSTLLGIPVIQNDFIEDKLEASKYIGFLANLQHYWILDSMSMELLVLHELYSRKNQIGFQSSYWGDGAPISKEAFVRLLPFDSAYARSGRSVETLETEATTTEETASKEKAKK